MSWGKIFFYYKKIHSVATRLSPTFMSFSKLKVEIQTHWSLIFPILMTRVLWLSHWTTQLYWWGSYFTCKQKLSKWYFYNLRQMSFKSLHVLVTSPLYEHLTLSSSSSATLSLFSRTALCSLNIRTWLHTWKLCTCTWTQLFTASIVWVRSWNNFLKKYLVNKFIYI